MRRAAKDERITTFDSVVRTLAVDDLLITDASRPIGIAGVIHAAGRTLKEGEAAAARDAAVVLAAERTGAVQRA